MRSKLRLICLVMAVAVFMSSCFLVPSRPYAPPSPFPPPSPSQYIPDDPSASPVVVTAAPSGNTVPLFNRSVGDVDFSGIQVSPWDISGALAALPAQPVRKYTIMLYLNGSNLEENGDFPCATNDLNEIYFAGLNYDEVNVLILTGGSRQWHTEGIPNDRCAVFLMSDEGLIQVAERVNVSMMNPGTLTGFIDFCLQGFPAERTGLIFWNHGGGSISGYGMDMLYYGLGMSLLDINLAMENSLAKTQKLEFVGFDACLMACLEATVVFSDYAKYFVASEETEPLYGWNYYFFEKLARNPDMDGKALCNEIVSYYKSFYDENSGYFKRTTLSAVDLGKIGDVVNALEALLAGCSSRLTSEGFGALSGTRSRTENFYGGSPRDQANDLIDLGSMAYQLSKLYPAEAAALRDALSDAVIVQGNASEMKNMSGLSIYYPYANKDAAKYSVALLKKLGLGPHYLDYIDGFARLLTGKSLYADNLTKAVTGINPEQSGNTLTVHLTPEEVGNICDVYFTVWCAVPDEADYYYMLGMVRNVDMSDDGTLTASFNGVWPGLKGWFACLYEIESTDEYEIYAIPAELDGRMVDLFMMYGDEYPNGTVLWAAPYSDGETGMAAKEIIEISDGQRVKLMYQAEYFGDDPGEHETIWYEGGELVINGSLDAEMLEANEGDRFLYGFIFEDYQQNFYYSDFMEMVFHD